MQYAPLIVTIEILGLLQLCSEQPFFIPQLFLVKFQDVPL